MTPPTAVVAESSLVQARQIASTLTAAGYEIASIVHDGMQAVQMIVEHQPTIVTVDLILPRLSGYHVAQAVKRLGCQTKVIAITAVSARDRVKAAREAGVSIYVLKPIDHEKLFRSVSVDIGHRLPLGGEWHASNQ